MSEQLPEMHSVASSSVASMGYDPATEKMYILFKSGQTYEYTGVKQADFEALMASPSIGSQIRKLPYSYRKMGS